MATSLECGVAGCHCRTGLASTTGREHQLLLSTSHTNADQQDRIGGVERRGEERRGDEEVRR